MSANLLYKGFRIEIIGNAAYYANSLILLVKDTLYSKPRCQKVLISKPFHMKSVEARVSSPPGRRGARDTRGRRANAAPRHRHGGSARGAVTTEFHGRAF